MNALATLAGVAGASRLGDAGTDNANYDGDNSSSAFSLQYYRDKATEFQSVLNALDAGYQSINRTLAIGEISDSLRDELQSMADEYQSKRFVLKATAEAINLGAASINSMGGRFPSLSLPGTLGAFIPALPFAAVAAFATAATLIVWGREWLLGYNSRMKLAMQIEAQDTPEAAAALARESAASDSALAISEQSGLAALAPAIKWLAIAVGAFMAYKALQPMLKGK